jgi:hypothetical protein
VVVVLDGAIRLEIVGRVDSVHKQLRVTFNGIPDAPMARFGLTLDGGRRGLLVNTIDLCRSQPRVNVLIDAHNGRHKVLHPRVKAACGRRSQTQ